jgi:predicted flap endonuclease-1-like 5' DNA nuclease
MFKEYKGLFKNLRDMQDQFWAESRASFPASAFTHEMTEWQRKTLEGVNDLVEQAIDQSLELQRAWLGQWKERVGSSKLKPKHFSELNVDAMNSAQRWLDNQNRIWDQWLQVLRATGGLGDLPGLKDWEESVQQSIQQQMALLTDWSDMAEIEKFSLKEAKKLSEQIARTMEKSIETQNRLWRYWLNELVTPLPGGQETIASKPKGKKKATAVKKQRASSTKAQSGDDLKQITGIGAALEKKLKENGISTLRQLADLSNDDIAQLEQQVMRFPGRIKREKWVQQAKKLIS